MYILMSWNTMLVRSCEVDQNIVILSVCKSCTIMAHEKILLDQKHFCSGVGEKIMYTATKLTQRLTRQLLTFNSLITILASHS